MLKTPVRDHDHVLRTIVEDELEAGLGVAAKMVGVAVSGGVVTLSGQLTSYADRWNAERAVERLDGVHGLVNEIEVHPSYERTDADIAMLSSHALENDISIPRDNVTVKVSSGWVTLKGDVGYDFQKRAAERHARSLPGVKGITSLIAVTPPVNVSKVKEKVEAAFERQAMIDARNITASTSDHNVTLSGTVRSWAERREAERAAAATPGVASVTNRLTVRN